MGVLFRELYDALPYALLFGLSLFVAGYVLLVVSTLRKAVLRNRVPVELLEEADLPPRIRAAIRSRQEEFRDAGFRPLAIFRVGNPMAVSEDATPDEERETVGMTRAMAVLAERPSTGDTAVFSWTVSEAANGYKASSEFLLLHRGVPGKGDWAACSNSDLPELMPFPRGTLLRAPHLRTLRELSEAHDAFCKAYAPTLPVREVIAEDFGGDAEDYFKTVHASLDRPAQYPRYFRRQTEGTHKLTWPGVAWNFFAQGPMTKWLFRCWFRLRGRVRAARLR